MAGYTRDGQDLFLEKRWALDENDWFAAEVEGAYGVWLPASQIAGIEFYRPTEDEEAFAPPKRRTRFEAVKALARAAKVRA